ncbi:hypothetical protein LguiB_022802 [Lonicera macranthoides]
MSLVQRLSAGESNDASEEQKSNDESQVQSTDQQLVTDFSIEKQIQMVVKNQVERLIKPALEDIIHGLPWPPVGVCQNPNYIFQLPQRKKQDEGRKYMNAEQRNLKLQFVNKIPGEIFTGKKIVGEEVPLIKIDLVDSLGQVVKTGPVASAKVEMVVLEGDFGGTNGDDWTLEEFDSKIVKEMYGRKSLLVGNELNLKEGSLVNEVRFTHNARWVKIHKFRLGAKVVDHFDGIKVKEAKTEPFTLKDYRTTYRQNHDYLSPHDEVWRMKGIAKNGPFHERLTKANIETMHNQGHKKWMKIVDHAENYCRIDKKVYLYPSLSSEQRTRVVLNVVGQMLGILLELQYVPINKLSQAQKADADMLVVSAFKHWKDVDHFDDESALNDLNPLNSTALENPSGYAASNPKMVDCDVDTPVTSYPVSSTDEMPIGLAYFGDDPDFQLPDFQLTDFQLPDFQLPDFQLPDFQFFSDGTNVLNAEEPHANENSDASDFLAIHVSDKMTMLSTEEPYAKQKGDAGGVVAMSRWKVVSGVWSSIMLLTRRRIVATEEIHVRKRRKHC